MLAEGAVLDKQELKKLLPPNLGVAVVPAGGNQVKLIMPPAVDCGLMIGPVISYQMEGFRAEVVTGERFVQCNPCTCPESEGCPIRIR